MARRRIMNYGPTVKTSYASSRRITVSDLRSSNRRGVILRSNPGLDHSITNKSALSRQQSRGIKMPGYHMPSQLMPNN